jgi:hypothetical protein
MRPIIYTTTCPRGQKSLILVLWLMEIGHFLFGKCTLWLGVTVSLHNALIIPE